MTSIHKKLRAPIIFTLSIALFSVTALLTPGVGAAGLDDFVVTVKTDNAGSSASTAFRIPVIGSGYNYSVDWDNDGSVDQTGITGSVTHDYGATGTYTFRVSGTFPRIYFNNGGDKLKILSVDQWGTGSWTSMQNAFSGTANFNITASDAPDLSGVTSMASMFLLNTSLNANLNSWDVSNVLSFQSLFFLASNFNGDISSWDVSGATNLSQVFLGASSFNQDISGWNVSTATSMSGMFSNATIFNQNISSWNVVNVTNMGGMFNGARAFNQPIGGWNMTGVTTISSMFLNAWAFNQDISSWDVSDANTMRLIFHQAKAFNQDISGWDVSNVADLSYSFRGTEAFDQDLSSWDVRSATQMLEMFNSSALSISKYDALLIGWNTLSPLQNGVVFGINAPAYCTSAAVAARASIISTYSWAITDDGQLCPRITNLDAGLSVEDAPSAGDLETTTHGILSSAVTTRIKTTSGLTVADVQVDLLTDRNWSSVIADSDVTTGKSFIHNLVSAPGTSSVYSLYVPYKANQGSVRICPGATSLASVTLICGSGYELTTASSDVTIVTVGGNNFWKIDNLNSTGGIGVSNTTVVYIDLTAQPATAPSTIDAAPEKITSSSDEFYVSYTPNTTEFGNTNTVTIIVPGTFTSLALCSSSTTDADGDTTSDGSLSITASDTAIYTFTTTTTTALTTGVEFCFSSTMPASVGNYNVAVYDDNDGDSGASLIYVSDDNDVTLNVSVTSVLSFEIKEESTTTNTNSCILGTLNPGSVNSCGYRLAAGTNLASGMQIYIVADDQLNTAGDTADIDDTTANTDVTTGIESHGITATLGTGWTIGASFSTSLDNPITLSETLLFDAAANVDYALEANWNTVTHSASVNSSTASGSYDQIVTYRAWADT